MKLHVQCFSIKVVPYSVNLESHIVTLPAPENGFSEGHFDDEDDVKKKKAYRFLLTALKEFLPPNLEREEASSIYGENEGFFFSCSDADSDAHYYLLLQYAFF